MDFSSAENPVLLPGPNAFARGPWRAKAWGFLVHDFGVPQQIYGKKPWYTMVFTRLPPTHMVFCEGFLKWGYPQNHPKGTQCMICEEQTRGGSQWFITPQHTLW
jgi:hypothetical protein